MTKIIVMTNLHATEPDEHIIRLNTFTRFPDTCAAEITAPLGAQMIVFVGDRARRVFSMAQARLRRVLDTALMFVILILGNHDLRKAFLTVSQTPRGFLCADRLQQLTAALAQTSVLAHHPRFDTGLVGMDADDPSFSEDAPPAYRLLVLIPDDVVADSEDVEITRPIQSEIGSWTPAK